MRQAKSGLAIITSDVAPVAPVTAGAVYANMVANGEVVICTTCAHPMSEHEATGQGPRRHTVCMIWGCKCGVGQSNLPSETQAANPPKRSKKK